jgi:hypothetical protein
MLLPDSSPLIHGLEKGKMHGGVARAHEKSPSVVKQKVVECYDTRQEDHNKSSSMLSIVRTGVSAR